jgi:DNA-binding transcriptional ArsR family regulator
MRRRILEQLREGPAAVGELARRLPISRPAVSQHLRVLSECGLVAYEEVGTRNVYRADPQGWTALRRWLDDYWTEALADFADAADRVDGHAPHRAGSDVGRVPRARTPSRSLGGPPAQHRRSQR